MKRPDNNTNNNSSKRLKQDQQLSFNEDVAEIQALLQASNEASNETQNSTTTSNESLQGSNVHDSTATSNIEPMPNTQSSSAQHANSSTGNVVNESRTASDEDTRLMEENHIYRNGINGDGNSNDTNIIPNELPQAPIRNNMSRLITSSDEEDDESIGRRWLSSGQRRAPRLGSEFQADLPTPGE